jgi:hypothetical protein
MACTSTKLYWNARFPYELDALKWKVIGRRRRILPRTSWFFLSEEVI